VINVVPAIDLLSCCISFLLITAVWTQISKLQIQQSGGPSAGDPVEQKQTLPLSLTMNDQGFTITYGTQSLPIPSLGKNSDGSPNYDVKSLEAKLKAIKQEAPDQAAITVAAEDSVLYQNLVKVIDLCIGAGLPNVSVTAAV